MPSRKAFAAILFGTAISVVLAVACSSATHQGSEATHAVRPVVLEAVIQRDGYLVLNSPTFRCSLDYCASAVLFDLQQTFSRGGWSYATAAETGAPTVQVRITYEPGRYTAAQFIDATRKAMEANPDPDHPGPIIVRSTWLPAEGR